MVPCMRITDVFGCYNAQISTNVDLMFSHEKCPPAKTGSAGIWYFERVGRLHIADNRHGSERGANAAAGGLHRHGKSLGTGNILHLLDAVADGGVGG